MIKQFEIELNPKSRGLHLVTSEIMDKLGKLPDAGILHLFIKHTSAGLCINENADPDVRSDLEKDLERLVPEGQPYYDHTLEGSDDMPAHTKSVLVGESLSIPVSESKLNLGLWQGIYLCEFRNNASSRKLIASIYY